MHAASYVQKTDRCPDNSWVTLQHFSGTFQQKKLLGTPLPCENPQSFGGTSLWTLLNLSGIYLEHFSGDNPVEHSTKPLLLRGTCVRHSWNGHLTNSLRRSRDKPLRYSCETYGTLCDFVCVCDNLSDRRGRRRRKIRKEQEKPNQRTRMQIT